MHIATDSDKVFRPLQRDVITASLDGHDVFLQAATSFGKSLCYQLPALIDHGSEYRSHLWDAKYSDVCSYNCHLTTSFSDGKGSF